MFQRERERRGEERRGEERRGEERRGEVKSLGKLFDSSLKDTATIQKSTEELAGWLTKVDKSGLPAMPGAKRETTYFRRRSEQAWRKSEWVGQWDSGSRGHGQVYDALPSPANLHAWGMSETPTCSLCSGRGSLQHLLSSCPKSLADGRYRWRHDQVLKAVAESIALAISTTKHHHAPKKAISFIKAGERPRAGPQITTGLLHTAPDWQLHVDLGKQLIFPQHIVTTSLRPDMIIISEASKYLIMLELTVPWEEQIEGANESKRAKYQELVEECRGRGWRTFYEPIDVGCRGFAGRSLCKAFGRLGVTGTAKKRAIKAASEAAEKATRWLWLKRADPWVATGTQPGS
ncbi:hypothetical protein D4764_10G0011340 [Takifugu flavidus]|uniref:Reverse transcriptase zinc-binding domain-containing protein n=1 Tax=Takifugu flavidus TaxID=433684 RepID=A0A5C6PK19_9TELE|nr:hypothetical protein D4764_10G0011340 [Takifugu flavidus]